MSKCSSYHCFLVCVCVFKENSKSGMTLSSICVTNSTFCMWCAEMHMNLDNFTPTDQILIFDTLGHNWFANDLHQSLTYWMCILLAELPINLTLWQTKSRPKVLNVFFTDLDPFVNRPAQEVGASSRMVCPGHLLFLRRWKAETKLNKYIYIYTVYIFLHYLHYYK